MAERKCTDEFCQHDHVSSPEKLALLAAIREAATLALNSVYGTDDRHEYMALRIADSAVNGTPLPWKLEPIPGHRREDVTTSGVAALRMAADSLPLGRPGQLWDGAADWLRRRADAIEKHVIRPAVEGGEG